MSVVFPLLDLEATKTLASRLAPLLRTHDVLLLKGDLGAGKTTFARFLLHALGVVGEVPSPTFTLVQSYDVPSCEGAFCPLHHFDLYRLKTQDEIEEIGFDEACGEGITLVEWPEKAASYMPRDALNLHFVMTETGQRQAHIWADEKWQARLEGKI